MISISKLRERLKLPAGEDSQLADIRDAVVALWEEETKRLWSRRAAHVQEIRVPASTRQTLFLELWPIETITKVEERWQVDPTWTEIAADQYILVRDNRIERLGAYWMPAVRVTFTGGYVPEPTSGAVPAQNKTPADVAEALLVQAEFQVKRNRGENMALNFKNQVGSGGATYIEGNLHPFFKRVAAQKARKV